jgi:hypothetical protein
VNFLGRSKLVRSHLINKQQSFNKPTPTNYLKTAAANTATEAIGDTGCTDLLLKHSSRHMLKQLQPCTNMRVTVADNNVIQSTETGVLRIPTSTGDIEIQGYIFPEDVLSQNLAGLSNLCNADCVIQLTKTAIEVSRNGETIWKGTKLPTEKLWNLDMADFVAGEQLTMNMNHVAHQAIHIDSDAELVKFIHAVLGSPPISTFIKAADKGWLSNWPRITAKMIRKNKPVTAITARAYLDQTRQGQNSTKPGKNNGKRRKAPRHVQEADEDCLEDDIEHDQLRFSIIERDDLKNWSDTTGRFPFATIQGFNYLLVSTYGGYVHLELLRDRSQAEYVRAYTLMYAFYKERGHQPRSQGLDNETSHALEAFLKAKAVDIEYVPPHNHRTNKSERAIRHTKNCIIAMCMTADEQFPANRLFVDVVEQAEIVINQLRSWKPDPTKNAWTGLHKKPYDHMAHPMFIYGSRGVIHDKTRESWAAHGREGFYLGPASKHYRCWRMYCSDTAGTQIADTVGWLPQPFLVPGHSPLEVLSAAVKDLAAAIRTINDTEQHMLSEHTGTAIIQQLSSSVQLLRDMYTSNMSDAPSTAQQETATPAGTPETTSPPEPTVQQPADDTVCPYCLVDYEGWAHDCPGGGRWGDNPNYPQPRRPAPVNQDASPPPALPAHTPAPIQRVRTRKQAVPQYQWKTIALKDVKGAKRRYFSKIDRVFIDDIGTQCVVSVDRNIAKQAGPGSSTLFYKYYNTTEHMRPPTNDNDYDWIPCAELLGGKGPIWTRASTLEQAMCATLLNLNPDGSPLTHKSALGGEHATEWHLSGDTEVRKLITETETMAVIHKSQIPRGRLKDIAYYNPRVREKIKDGEVRRRTRGTIGGDKVNYTGEVTARTAALEVMRALLNSTLADNASWMTADITDYYLNTPLLRPEYMRIMRKQLSETIIAEYGWEQYFVDDMIYFQINKGMYGLPQAGLLAQQRLIAHIAKHGYTQSDTVPCLFRHATNGVTFVLVVDDFGIKYQNEAGRDHLLDTLKLLYKITEDAQGEQYLGMTIVHDKTAGTFTISMPGYIAKVLKRFHEWVGTRKAKSPGVYQEPHYGAKVQYATWDDTDALTKAEAKTLQEIVGSILYYARAVDPTMLPTTNHIASEQSTPTAAVKARAVQLLQYAAAYPDNAIVFKKSKMHLIIQADASYLSRSKARSVAGGVFYFGDASKPEVENGMVHAVSSIIDVVVASAGESEYGAGFIMAQHGVWLRNIAIALGHPQPATPLLSDNNFCIGLCNDTIKQKRSKSIDMRFHWLRDRIRQGQFTIAYIATEDNLADFFTKTLPPKKHQAAMPRLVLTPQQGQAAQAHWTVRRKGRNRPA